MSFVTLFYMSPDRREQIPKIGKTTIFSDGVTPRDLHITPSSNADIFRMTWGSPTEQLSALVDRIPITAQPRGEKISLNGFAVVPLIDTDAEIRIHLGTPPSKKDLDIYSDPFNAVPIRAYPVENREAYVAGSRSVLITDIRPVICGNDYKLPEEGNITFSQSLAGVDSKHCTLSLVTIQNIGYLFVEDLSRDGTWISVIPRERDAYSIKYPRSKSEELEDNVYRRPHHP